MLGDLPEVEQQGVAELGPRSSESWSTDCIPDNISPTALTEQVKQVKTAHACLLKKTSK